MILSPMVVNYRCALPSSRPSSSWNLKKSKDQTIKLYMIKVFKDSVFELDLVGQSNDMFLYYQRQTNKI